MACETPRKDWQCRGEAGPVGVFSVAVGVRSGNDAEGLTSVEGKQTVRLPTVSEPLGAELSNRDEVVDIAAEGVAGIEVTVPILCLDVCAVLRQVRNKTGLIVQRMGPGIGRLGCKTVPV
jgi:hypothetical protein